MSTEIEQVTLAVTAINQVEKGLTDLRSQYQGVVFEVATPAGMDAAKEARQAVRKPRLEVERIRKAAKAPILALGKKLDNEAARITAELEKIEGPIHEQIVAEESRREAEKQAKIAAEQARVEGIQRRIDRLRSYPQVFAALGSEQIAVRIDELASFEIDASFEEFYAQATEAKRVSLEGLAHLHAIAVAREAEQERIRLEREELAKLRAEQTERDRVAKEAQAAADAEAKKARDAEAARIAESHRVERERIAAEKRENDRIAAERQAELDRQAEEQRRAKAIEEKRIADERAELERREAAIAEANKPKAKPRKVPTGQELVEVVAKHFGVEPKVALAWLLKIDWKQEKAA